MASPYLHAITCSKCGAGLDPGSGERILVCPYCQTSHVFAPPLAKASAQRPKFPALALALAGLVALVAAGSLLAFRGGAASSAPELGQQAGPGDPLAVYAAEQKVDIWHVSRWYPGRVRRADGRRYFVTYDGWSESWDEWVTAKRLRRQSDAKAASVPVKNAQADTTRGDPSASFVIGQAVDIYWGSRWWPGRVLNRDGSRYRITYDGWASSWDEWVQAERMRPRDQK